MPAGKGTGRMAQALPLRPPHCQARGAPPSLELGLAWAAAFHFFSTHVAQATALWLKIALHFAVFPPVPIRSAPLCTVAPSCCCAPFHRQLDISSTA